MPQSTIVEWVYWTAQTKRNPAAVGGKIGVPAVELQSVALMPPMPAPAEIIERYSYESPLQAFVTYADKILDVQEGDDVEFLAAQNVGVADFGTSDRIFSVFGVALWHDPNHPVTEILLEKVEGT